MAAAPPLLQQVDSATQIHPTYILQPIGIPIEEAENLTRARTLQAKHSKIGMAMTGEGAARKRISVACNRCRKRKIRCTSSAHPKICEPCMMAGVDHECVYTRNGQKELTLADLLRLKQKNTGVAASTATPPAPAPVTLGETAPLNYNVPQSSSQEYGQPYPAGQATVPPSPSQSLLGQSYTLSTTDNSQYTPYTPSTFSQPQSQWSTPMTPTTPMTMGYGGSSYGSSPYTPSPYQATNLFRYSWNQPYYSIPANPTGPPYQTTPISSATGTQDLPRPGTVIAYAPSYYPLQYPGPVTKPTQDMDAYQTQVYMNKPAEPVSDAASDQNTITADNTPRAHPVSVSTYHQIADNLVPVISPAPNSVLYNTNHIVAPVTPPARTATLYNTDIIDEEISPKTQTFQEAAQSHAHTDTNTNNGHSVPAIAHPEPAFALPAPANTSNEFNGNGFNGLGPRRRSRSHSPDKENANADTASNASWRPALKKKRARRRMRTIKGRARLDGNGGVETEVVMG